MKYNALATFLEYIRSYKVTSTEEIEKLISNYIEKYNLDEHSKRVRIEELKIKEEAFIMAGAIISGLEYDVYSALYDDWFNDAQGKVNFYMYKYSQDFPPKLQKDESK